jgi:hypothetical protein
MAALEHLSPTANFLFCPVRSAGAFHICDTSFEGGSHYRWRADRRQSWASVLRGQRPQSRDECYKLTLAGDTKALVHGFQHRTDRSVCQFQLRCRFL